MAQAIKCRHCGESFIPKPGKRGYIDECPECLSERYEAKPTGSGSTVTSTAGYTFSLETYDGRGIAMDGREEFGYNEVEPVGQMALVAMQTTGQLFSVALTSGATNYDGEWKAGRRWKVPTPQPGRIPAVAAEARKHQFSYVSDYESYRDNRPLYSAAIVPPPAAIQKKLIVGLPSGVQRPPDIVIANRQKNDSDREKRIAGLLIANREGGTDWGEFSRPESKPWSKKFANRFLLCCLLDYQIPSDTAWANGYRLIDDILHNPDDVWQTITSPSEEEWNSKHYKYRLHRFPAAHQRLWRIGTRICLEFDGDARRIWERRDAQSVLETLWNIGAGDQISRMIVGALRDCNEIVAKSSDVKGDVYVRRVLGRALLGNETDAETAVLLAARLHPDDPWQLDAQLWEVGKTYCTAENPHCPECYLASNCAYASAVHR